MVAHLPNDEHVASGETCKHDRFGGRSTDRFNGSGCVILHRGTINLGSLPRIRISVCGFLHITIQSIPIRSLDTVRDPRLSDQSTPILEVKVYALRQSLNDRCRLSGALSPPNSLGFATVFYL